METGDSSSLKRWTDQKDANRSGPKDKELFFFVCMKTTNYCEGDYFFHKGPGWLLQPSQENHQFAKLHFL